MTVPICKLVEDMAVYPRHAVDDGNVSSLVNAIKAGAALPAIVAEEKSLRIVDGWHRARAYRRVLGADGAVDVELKHYKDDNALLLDAVERNAAHGRKLDVIDQIRVATLCEERGIAIPVIARVLHLPEERVHKLRVRIATAPAPGPGTMSGTARVALKRPVSHLAGGTFTQEQAKAHESVPGTSYLLVTNQLLDALAFGFINTQDERLLGSLKALHKRLTEFLRDFAAAA